MNHTTIIRRYFASAALGALFATGWLLIAPLALAEELRIAVIGDMSEPTSLGQAIRYGVSLAIEDAKSSGDLSEHVQIVGEDDQCRPDLARAKAQKVVVSDRVNLVIGHTCPVASLAASEVYQSAGIIQIDPATTDPILTERTRPKPASLFRVVERQDRSAAIAVAALHDRIVGKNVSLIGGGPQQKWLDRFQVLAKITTNSLTVRASIPDQTSDADLSVIYDPYHRTNLTRDDVYAVCGLDDRFEVPIADNNAIKSLSKRMNQAGSSAPVGAAINAYASVQVWIRAMKEAHSTDANKITEQIRKLKFETIKGLISFDEIGDVRQPVVTIVRFSTAPTQVPNECNEPKCKDCACSQCCPK